MANGDSTVTRRPPTLLRSCAHSAGPGQPGSPGRTPPAGRTATPPAGAAKRDTSGSPATPATPFKNTRLRTSPPPSGGSTITGVAFNGTAPLFTGTPNTAHRVTGPR